MYTATHGVTLPTTVTGSWPRPEWFKENLDGRSVSAAMTDVHYRERFTDAVAAVISDQERAGLDILVNGDYHLDNNLGGSSWMLWAGERLRGVDTENVVKSSGDWAWTEGTLLHEVMSGWCYPPVVSKIEEGIPFEYDKVWRIAQQKTDKPIKFGAASAQITGSFLENHTDYYDDDKRQLIWDVSAVVNKELRRLADAGCKVIQIECPLLHLYSVRNPPREYMDFLIDAVNRETQGLDGVEIWMHICWGNPNMQQCVPGANYASTLEDYLYRVNCDVLAVEMKDRNYDEIELFGHYNKDAKRKIAIGTVSHRTLQVEPAEEIADDLRLALKHIDADKLVLTSDCGFGRQGFNRLVAYYKAAAMVRAANVVRAELGVPVTHPRNDDHATQTDPKFPKEAAVDWITLDADGRDTLVRR